MAGRDPERTEDFCPGAVKTAPGILPMAYRATYDAAAPATAA